MEDIMRDILLEAKIRLERYRSIGVPARMCSSCFDVYPLDLSDNGIEKPCYAGRPERRIRWHEVRKVRYATREEVERAIQRLIEKYGGLW